MAGDVGECLGGDAVEHPRGLLTDLLVGLDDDLEGHAGALEDPRREVAQRADQALPQARRLECEEHPPQPVKGVVHREMQGVDLGRDLVVGARLQPLLEQLHAQVDGSQHLDRVVVHPAGELVALGLLGREHLQEHRPVLLGHLVLGFAGLDRLGDVDRDGQHLRERPVVGQPGLVPRLEAVAGLLGLRPERLTPQCPPQVLRRGLALLVYIQEVAPDRLPFGNTQPLEPLAGRVRADARASPSPRARRACSRRPS